MLRSTRKVIVKVLKYGVVSLMVVVYFWKGIFPTIPDSEAKSKYSGRFQAAEGYNGGQPSDSEPYDVLVLAYMRSGSSYMGRVLGVREDTFYWYEPLWKSHHWAYLNDEGEFCNHSYPHCTAVSDESSRSAKTTLQFLLDVYACANLSQYYNSRFAEDIHGSRAFMGSLAMKYLSCSKESSKEKCFETMMESCGKAKHRVTKVLRMNTAHTQFLLDHNPRLKVVQIFRDPRAVLSSRKQVKWYFPFSKELHSELGMSVDDEDILSHDAEVLCKRMAGDIDTAKRLRELYPDRMKIVQYEDMNDARILTETMYRFANMNMTEGAKRRMNSMTRKKRNRFPSQSYRARLEWSEVNIINQHCRSVFEKLGLRVFESEKELEDTTLNFIKKSLPFPLN